MKILIKQFLGKNHSWAICGQNIARSLIKKGHTVHLFSTDGVQFLPEDLKPYLIGHYDNNQLIGNGPDNQYDSQISYTAMKNFPVYLQHGSQNRFGIYCYEFSGRNALPEGFAKNYKFCDKLLPPSRYAFDIFKDSGVPESHMEIVPHGIDVSKFESVDPYPLNVPQKMKVLINIAQPHLRKNLRGLFCAIGKAFNKNDDVCFVFKIVDKKPSQPFEVSFNAELNLFKKAFPNHPPIKIITNFIPNIESLYKACNVTFSLSRCECFHFPSLEGLAAGHIVIAPRHGGQLDFLNDDNSLLIDGVEEPAPPAALYWQSKMGTNWFAPSVSSAVKQLQRCYKEFDQLKEKFASNAKAVVDIHSWDKATDKILSLVK